LEIRRIIGLIAGRLRIAGAITLIFCSVVCWYTILRHRRNGESGEAKERYCDFFHIFFGNPSTDGMKETQLRFLAVSFSFEFTENTSELGYQFPRCAQFGIRLKFVRFLNSPKAGPCRKSNGSITRGDEASPCSSTRAFDPEWCNHPS